ncbi:hypothetical protein [Streptomyces sp. MBT49]|uniref:hypothetical protein n=1 Tax=Streptomyces sp. MBT49 TaxID=1488380 RepID=UPI00190CD0B4|nr:hypothetical protein [Streptomyces sp. MBT49]
MTPAGRAAFALYGTVLVVTVSTGALHLQAGDRREGLVFYAVALAVLVGMLREASRSVLDEPRNLGPWRRWRAGRETRRIVRAQGCTCDTTWWPAPGRPHSPGCPALTDRSRSE